MRMRSYQQEAKQAAVRAWTSHQSTLIQLPTGTGKTIVLAGIAQEAPSRSIVMAHTDDLVQQAADKIRSATDCTVGIEMGNEKVDENGRPPRVIVTSVQSMSRDSRLARFDPARFSRLIIDEGHHALGKSYRKVQQHFQQNADLRTLLTTATPKRTDKRALSQVCDSIAYTMSIEDAIDQGWLVYPEAQSVVIDGLDFSELRTVGGDFSLDELEALLTATGPLQGMAKATVDMARDEPTIVFCCTVKHAYLASEILNSYRRGSATFLAGEASYAQLKLAAVQKEERRVVLDRYRQREIQFLCLCQLGLEGFDAPATVNVAMWRATQSVSVYAQCFGRGTRPAEEIAGKLGDLASAEERVQLIRQSSKPVMRMLDFRGNAGKHQICDLTDLLGGKYGFPVRTYAKKLLDDEGKTMRPDELLERSQAEMDWLEYVRAERAKREALAKSVGVNYRAEAVDPFGRGAAVAVPQAAKEPPTLNQIWRLVRLGVAEDVARGYSRKQAGVVIGKMLARQGVA